MAFQGSSQLRTDTVLTVVRLEELLLINIWKVEEPGEMRD